MLPTVPAVRAPGYGRISGCARRPVHGETYCPPQEVVPFGLIFGAQNSLTQKRRLRARHMSVPLQPQIFAAMAFVTHWVKCAAVGTPDRSRTGRERSASIAFCRVMETADLRDSYDPTKFWRLHSPRFRRVLTQ